MNATGWRMEERDHCMLVVRKISRKEKAPKIMQGNRPGVDVHKKGRHLVLADSSLRTALRGAG